MLQVSKEVACENQKVQDERERDYEGGSREFVGMSGCHLQQKPNTLDTQYGSEETIECNILYLNKIIANLISLEFS